MLQPLFLATLGVNNATDPWAPLAAGLEAWAALSFDADFAVNVGTVEGRKFVWQSPGFTMKSRVAGASLSKWPAAIMISGLVNDGIMKYDDLASKHLSWWSTDKADPRSRITLRHLLTFTSGFTEDVYDVPKCSGFLSCAEAQFKASSKGVKEPGTHWAYLSVHLQMAGAMAASASGLPIQKLFAKYLYTPFNMTSTSWSDGDENPSMAAGIKTTGDDFEQMMQRLLAYSVLPKTILDQQPVVGTILLESFGKYSHRLFSESLMHSHARPPQVGRRITVTMSPEPASDEWR